MNIEMFKRYWCAVALGWKTARAHIKSFSHSALLSPLTPVDRSQDTEPSLLDRELLAALDGRNDKAIQNIALTGPYSVGKSTQLRSFFARYTHFKPLFVSLAKFDELSVSDDKNHFTPEMIEESIVQQLIYSADSSSLPASRFRRIKHQTRLKTITQACSLLLLALSTIWLTYHYKHDDVLALLNTWIAAKVDPKDWMFTAKHVFYFDLAGITALLLLGGRGLYQLVQVIRASVLNLRFNMQGASVELKQQDSPLHRHLDELIYYFASTQRQVVVIEDLDRFEDVSIFNHLREINNIINRAPSVKRKVYFIYAVRDDLFKPADRTKFFDLIFPVVPVISYESSAQRFFERLEAITDNGTAITTKLDKELIETIALYSDDLRLLLNIANEFEIYRHRLIQSNRQLDVNKMLAMIAIKNYYPEEHKRLTKNEGPIYELLTTIRDSGESILATLETDRARLVEQLKERKSSFARTQKEIVCSFIPSMHNHFPHTQYRGEIHLLAESGWINLNHALKTNVDFTKVGNWQLRAPGNAYNIPVNDIKNSRNYTLPQELKSHQESIAKINAELAGIERQLRLLSGQSLAERLQDSALMSKINVQASGLSLVCYTLQHAYLEWDYFDYISDFQAGSLTQQDKETLGKLRRRQGLEFDAAFERIETLVPKMYPSDLINGQGLISQLLEHLLTSKPSHKYECLLDKALDISNSDIPRLHRSFFSLSYKAQEVLAERLVRNHIQILKAWLENFDGGLEQQSLLAHHLLNRHNTDQLELLVADIPPLLKFISDSACLDVLLPEPNRLELLSKCESLEIEFHQLAPGLAERSLLEDLLASGCYTLNKQMLEAFIQQLAAIKEPISYDVVKQSTLKILINRVDTSIDEFFALFYVDKPPHNKAAYLDLLNHTGLSIEHKLSLIPRSDYDFVISEIEDDYRKAMLPVLLKAKKLEINWKHAWLLFDIYRSDKSHRSELIDWLNDNDVHQVLGNKSIAFDLNKEFLRWILSTDEIFDEAMDHLLKPHQLNNELLNPQVIEQRGLLLASHPSVPSTNKVVGLFMNYAEPKACTMFLEKRWAGISFDMLITDYDISASLCLQMAGQSWLSTSERLRLFAKVTDRTDAKDKFYTAYFYALEDALNEGLELPPYQHHDFMTYHHLVAEELILRLLCYYLNLEQLTKTQFLQLNLELTAFHEALNGNGALVKLDHTNERHALAKQMKLSGWLSSCEKLRNQLHISAEHVAINS